MQWAHLGEQYHAVDPVRPCLAHAVEEPVPPAQAVHPRHATDGDVLLAIVHKQGQNEVVGAQKRLRDGPADGGAPPVPSRP